MKAPRRDTYDKTLKCSNAIQEQQYEKVGAEFFHESFSKDSLEEAKIWMSDVMKSDRGIGEARWTEERIKTAFERLNHCSAGLD